MASSAYSSKIPAILSRHRSPSISHLRKKLIYAYPQLTQFWRRTPSTPLEDPGGCAKKRSVERLRDGNDELRVFVTWLGKEVDKNSSVLRVVAYGVCEYGNVVRLEVENFRPYLYVKYPTWWGGQEGSEMAEGIAHGMEEAVRRLLPKKKTTQMEKMAVALGLDKCKLVTSVSVEYHMEAIGYRNDEPSPFLKVSVLSPELVPYFRRAAENPSGSLGIESEESRGGGDFRLGDMIPWAPRFCSELMAPRVRGRRDSRRALNVYEGDYDYTMRFCTDKNLKCSAWWCISAGKLREHACVNVDLHIVTTPRRIRALEKRHRLYEKIPEDFIFLFDGEMEDGEGKGRFPSAARGDPIDQIGVQIISTEALIGGMTLRDAFQRKKFVSLMLSRLDVESFASVSTREELQYPVHSLRCEGELGLIRVFEEIFLLANPSYCVAYNGNQFDFPYMLDRAFMLTMNKPQFARPVYDFNVGDYIVCSRDLRVGRGITHRPADKVTTSKTKRASVRTSYANVTIPGVVNIDMYLFVRQYAKYGLKGFFSLDAVSLYYLGEKKLDIDYERIYHMFRDRKGRLEVAQYCNRDVELMTRLLSTLGQMDFLWTLGKITMSAPQQLVDRGTQFLITNLWYAEESVGDFLSLYKKGSSARLLAKHVYEKVKAKKFPEQKVTPRFLLPSGKFYVKELEGPRTLKEGESFAGAVVVEPDIGLKGPTSTYDFASLYPSESCSKNLCFTTMIPHRNKEEVLDKMRGFCRVARLNAENMTWERTENWFVTGERPCALTDLREAISILRAEDCPYDAETRAALQKDVDILEDPVNAEMARKWTPLAEGRPANLADGDAPPSDDELVDIYLRIVEPACRILGRTKTNVRRPDMPAFVQEEMREGVFPHIQKNLKQMRNAVKREMGDYCNQLEGLSREGVRDSDGSVVRLKQSVKKMDTVQQAIKCVMNSIYGVYAIFSKMLAETVTDLGRSDLETSLCIVDTMIGRQTGFISRSIGVYGDTDSVFGEWVDLPLYAEEEMLLKKIRIQKRDTGGQEEGWEACMTRAREVGVAVRERLGLEESSSTKIAMYVCWYLAMKDVLDGNCMNLAALPRTQRFTPSDLRVFQNKMDWLANLMISSLGVDVSSVQSMISNSEWKGIGRAANPPSLPPSGRPFEPIMLHDFVCWISIQIVNGQSKKVEGLMNGVFKRKHPTGYIVQEHEKTYRRLLLCRKKKYGGSKYLPGGSTYKVDLAGVTAVRGDTYPFKALACKKVMEALADYGDVDLATALAEDIIRRVVQRKISPHQLIQSKKVKKDVTEYGAAQPHGLEQIVPTKGMPLHIVGAIERHLDTGEPLPLVDSRYAFLVRDVPGKKKIKIGKRIMSPVDVLRAGGSLLYDTEYYAEGIANLVSNILAPVIDPSTGEQRLKIAEGFRRIRDKSVRSKAVNKHFETLRRHTKKIMMTFAQQGAKHQKDSPHGRASSSSSSRRDSLQQRSIKSMFQATAAPCRAVQSSDAKDSDQDDDNAGESSTGVTDSRAILTATLTRESEARLWKKISSLSKISVGEGVKSTAYNPSGSAGVLSSTLAEKESTTQASMLTFAVAVSIECGCCGRPGNKGHFCRRCVRSGRVAETVALVEKKIVDAMVDQAHVCADCYGVARPDVGGEERRKRTRGEDPTDSRGRSILDIEDCVGEFYERNQTVKACMRIVCQTRWERAELENQLKMVKLLRTQYVLFSNKRVKK